jgi:hypothetical protein
VAARRDWDTQQRFAQDFHGGFDPAIGDRGDYRRDGDQRDQPGPELLHGIHPVLWKLGLSYFMPFAVASYGAYSAFRSTADGISDSRIAP